MRNIIKYQDGTGKAGVTSGPTQGSLQAKKDAWAADSLPKIQTPKSMIGKAVQLNPPTIKAPTGSGPTTVKQQVASTLGKAGVTNGMLNRIVDSGIDYVSDSIIGTKRDNSINQRQQTIQNGIINGLGFISPALKYGVKALNTLQYATNSQVDAMTKDQANRAGVGLFGRAINNTMATLPATFAGRLYGATDDAYVSKETLDSRGAFADSVDDVEAAQGMGGRNILAGRLKFNNFINDVNYVNDIITRMKRTNTMHKDNSAAQDIASANNRMYAGSSYASDRTYAGKEGMKMLNLVEVTKLFNKPEEVPAFQNGGVIGVDTNILPEGALHAHKNHLEDVNEDIGSQVTEKGIPVIATNENCDIKQVAEIEREELTLRAELTKQIEDLWKKWQEAEDAEEKASIAEEAGKILAEEIITNTTDLTGQLENDGK